jgi:hypothetical protein
MWGGREQAVDEDERDAPGIVGFGQIKPGAVGHAIGAQEAPEREQGGVVARVMPQGGRQVVSERPRGAREGGQGSHGGIVQSHRHRAGAGGGRLSSGKVQRRRHRAGVADLWGEGFAGLTNPVGFADSD